MSRAPEYPSNSVLTISRALKRFGETEALRGAELALGRGEWLALLGPNGAGKTTLVRAVAGRVRLDGGEITLLGKVLEDDAPARAVRAKLGVVPQDIAVYPTLTARENLKAWGRLHGVPAASLRERTVWALEWTGLAERGDELVSGFSGGMKRRLNIACGVLHRPEVVLLDEPTVGVDPQSRVRIWEMLRQLQVDGASLLLTTHQLDEAQEVCDRIVIVDHGRTIADGTFEELVLATLGSGRRVVCELTEAVPRAPEGFELHDRERHLTCHVDDIASELPRLLTTLDSAGHTVVDVGITSPTLQAVFIELTGRELRE